MAVTRVLISYWYFKDKDVRQWTEKGGLKLFADSGAFSAWTQGIPVDVAKYADWLYQWDGHFAAYANLDIRGDMNGSWANLQYLESRGLSPIPVYHMGEPLEYYQEMVDSYPYVAIGGVAGMRLSSSKIIAGLIPCFARRGKAAIHGFGTGGQDIIMAFPWYSVDSTSWASGLRYGQIQSWNPRRRRIETVSTTKGHLRGRLHISAIGAAEKYRRGDPGVVWREAAALESIRAYDQLARWHRMRWGQVPGPPDDVSGIHMYYAVSADKEMRLIFAGKGEVS